jgi:Ring finger domain
MPKPEDLKFECEVCYEGFNDQNVFPLANCEHVYHQECMKNFLKAEIEGNKCPLVCMNA